jgi:hypothetical protein
MNPTEQRFWIKVRKTKSCWYWIAGIDANGYGRFLFDGKNRLAHNVAFILVHGEIPKGMTVDHLCHNGDLDCAGGKTCIHRTCVNPDHLEAKSLRENVLASENTIASINSKKTMCPRKHLYTPENTYISSKGRECRKCRYDALRRHRGQI